jgi:predicted MPP superfamily phosphohydrolase
MKKFYLNTFKLVILLTVISLTAVNGQKNVVHYISDQGELKTTIRIPDLADTLKIMQITDSHISITDDSEAEYLKYGERMHKAYMYPRKHYSLDTSETTFAYLDDLLSKAKREKIDLLLLTGDIVNFPSVVSVKYVYDRLMKTGIPWLYISGNHDWHYEGMEGSLDSLRKTWIERSLLPFYKGLNPLFFSEIIDGINFVGIDNSTNQVNEKQVGFLKEQLKREEPVILLSHIPYDLNNSGARQPGMISIIDVISSNTDKIVAIIAGHMHRSGYYFTGNLCQYTSLPAFEGAAMTILAIPY